MILRRTLSVAGARLSLAGADYSDKRAWKKKKITGNTRTTIKDALYLWPGSLARGDNGSLVEGEKSGDKWSTLPVHTATKYPQMAVSLVRHTAHTIAVDVFEDCTNPYFLWASLAWSVGLQLLPQSGRSPHLV